MFGNIIIYLRSGVLIKTLSHIWGKLNLPTLLLRVGLLTLINMNSLQVSAFYLFVKLAVD